MVHGACTVFVCHFRRFNVWQIKQKCHPYWRGGLELSCDGREEGLVGRAPQTDSDVLELLLIDDHRTTTTTTFNGHYATVTTWNPVCKAYYIRLHGSHVG